MPDIHDEIADMIEADDAAVSLDAPPAAPHPAEGEPPQPSEADFLPSDGLPPVPPEGEDAFGQTIAACSELDQSDTDNGKRLIAYYGKDILIMQQSGIAGGDWLHWCGTHWDMDSGLAGVTMIAQKVGDLIQREADYMAATPSEAKAIEAAKAAKIELVQLLAAGDAAEDGLTDDQAERVAQLEEIQRAGKQARADLNSRKKKRRDFGVGSKNGARIDRMMAAAAPHLRKPIDEFNPDPLLITTSSHTLRLVKSRDLDCPDPDVVRWKSEVIADAEHRPSDFSTSLVPAVYDADAHAAHWTAFLERMLPDENVRRTVQQFSGLGLTGLPVQKFMFHYGEGANGKSVFLETLVRLLGKSFAVGLPTESIIGSGDRNAGGASPDLFRLFGKRMVRVLELPEGKPLQSELIKKLTGGEEIPVRTLFKGFIDFQPRAKPHMSGNGLPKITDTSKGIWRRMLFVNWPVTLAESEQRDIEDVLGELLAERSGILNWLIDGALDYLANGLYIAPSVERDTLAYRKEMDIVLQFFEDCVEAAPGEKVQARTMFESFKHWCNANAKAEIHETRFGRDMKKHCQRDDTARLRFYLDVRLHDVPAAPLHGNEPPHPADDLVPL
jgi:putative DNA primase/helicase